MKAVYLTFWLFISCFATHVLAHPDHTILEFDDAASEAKFNIVQLIENKSLTDTWQEVQPNLEKSGIVSVQGKRRWVFIFENPQENDPTKKAVKILMTPLGKFMSYEFVK